MMKTTTGKKINEKVLKLHRREIIYVVSEQEELNYEFCEKFYEKEDIIVILLDADRSKIKFDSDSNVVEVNQYEEFFKTIEESLDNGKIVIVHMNDIKIPEDDLQEYERMLMEMGNIYIFSDEEIKHVAFQVQSL